MKNKPQQTAEQTAPVVIYNPQPVEPTMRSIMKKKYLSTLEKAGAGDIFLTMFDIFMCFVICSFLVFPKPTSIVIFYVMSFYGFAIPKVIGGILSIVLLRNRKAIIRFFRSRDGANQYTLEGIPVPELLDFLFRTGGFLLAEAKGSPLFLSRKIYDRLAPKLEELEILIRGANNSRLLNPDLTREEVAETLKTSNKARTLTRAVQIIQNGKKNFRTRAELEAT